MSKIYLKYNDEYIEISKAGKKVSGSWIKGEILSIFQKHSGEWTTVETATPTDNILTFTARTFSAGDVVTVEGSGSVSDTFTFDS